MLHYGEIPEKRTMTGHASNCYDDMRANTHGFIESTTFHQTRKLLLLYCLSIPHIGNRLHRRINREYTILGQAEQ